MITLQEIEDIKKGPAKVKINSITFDYPDQVLINGYKLSDLIESVEAYGKGHANPIEALNHKTCHHCGRSHVITTKVITIGEGRYSEAETDLCLECGWGRS